MIDVNDGVSHATPLAESVVFFEDYNNKGDNKKLNNNNNNIKIQNNYNNNPTYIMVSFAMA